MQHERPVERTDGEIWGRLNEMVEHELTLRRGEALTQPCKLTVYVDKKKNPDGFMLGVVLADGSFLPIDNIESFSIQTDHDYISNRTEFRATLKFSELEADLAVMARRNMYQP